MADLGAGGASDYPTSLDSDPTPEVGTNNTNHLPIVGVTNAVIAIQTELGPDVAGTKTNLVTYLAVEHNTDGTHKFLEGSATWDPGSIANGAEEAKEVTVTGAVLGDVAIASFSLDVTDLAISASVTAADTVTVLLLNNTGGAIDLASGTVRAMVIGANT